MTAQAEVDRDGTRDRAALVAVAVQFWINGMVYAAVVPRLPELRDRLDIGVAALGLLLTVGSLGGLVGSALASRVIAAFGTKRIIVGATIATLVVLPLVGIVEAIVGVAVVLAIMSMLDVWIDISMNMQGSLLSKRRTVPVMNRLHGLWSLGTVIGGLAAVQLTDAGVSLRTHFLGLAGLLGVVLALSGRHLLSSEAVAEHEAGDTVAAEGDGGHGVEIEGVGVGGEAEGAAENVEGADGELGGPGGRAGSGRFGMAGRYWLLAVLGAAAVTMELTTSDWAAFRLADDLSVDPGRVAIGFVAFTSGMVTGRLSGDAVQARIGARALVRLAASIAAVGLVLATVVSEPLAELLPGAWTSAAAVSVAGFYIAALGVSVAFPQLYDAAARTPGPPGRGLASLTAGTRLAGLAAPALVGLLAATSLSVGAAVAIVTIPCVLLVGFVVPTMDLGD